MTFARFILFSNKVVVWMRVGHNKAFMLTIIWPTLKCT